jgi:multidrug resistance efflux pump
MSENNNNNNANNNPGAKKAPPKFLIMILIFLFIAGGLGGGSYLYLSSKVIKIDKSGISAPMIGLSPHVSGTLDQIFVHPGDKIGPDTIVARVGTELLKSKVAGIVIDVKQDIGKNFNPGESVVTMIDPHDLRVVGQIDENKGLDTVSIGQRVEFTVDTFGSKKFYGFVDEVSPTSRSGDVVFSISDKRETKQFDIKVRYNIDEYQELDNGMSAKLTIYKK